jgi:transcriptional regulator with XRE-family HTH domain
VRPYKLRGRNNRWKKLSRYWTQLAGNCVSPSVSEPTGGLSVAKHSNALTEVGERIRLARERRGLTQEALGKMLGVSFQMVQAYEHEAKLSLKRLHDVASCLAIDPDWLFTGRSSSRILKQTNEDLRALMPGHVGFYGRHGRDRTMVDVDMQVKAMCGVPAAAPLIWEHWLDGIHADDRVRIIAELACLQDPRNGIFNARYRLIGRDGVERCIIDYGHMIFDATGEPMRLQGMMLDITQEPRIDSIDEKIECVLVAVRQRWQH